MIINIQDDILKLHAQGLLDRLLCDKTTRRNILWAANTYAALGPQYAYNEEMTSDLITGHRAFLIKTRARKAMEQQSERTRRHAEVFTPLRICRQMNDYADEMWFGSAGVFYESGVPPVSLSKRKSWKRYVDSRRLEITCGEAPYLVSRYDVETGEAIPVSRRTGLLDRKLRAVGEAAGTEEEWLTWAERAFQASYGFEFQGDNLLIARINLLMTFEEYLQERWARKPSRAEYEKFAGIVAWNLWQMDGLTGRIPCEAAEEDQISDYFSRFSPEFAIPQKEEQPLCLIYNWRGKCSAAFSALPTKGKQAMKFDFIIGNPPYQDERKGTSTTALPIYHEFMSACYAAGEAVELITPARFLFNAGRTPKQWNEQMLQDEHLKVLYYERDASTIFPNTEIKGGVVITYRDAGKTFPPIGTFTMYPELNEILRKVTPFLSQGTMASLAFVASKFNAANLFADYPELDGHERRMSSNVLSFPCFRDEPDGEESVRIYGIYRKKRTGRYLAARYVDLSDPNLPLYKIVMPKADGSGAFGDTLTAPELLPPRCGFTHTFLGMGGFASEDEAESALKYIKTKFARALLGVLKVTQDINAEKWKYVPLQDFTPSSDIDWSGSTSEIDRQLYAKYGLSEDEIRFVERHVKEMK